MSSRSLHRAAALAAALSCASCAVGPNYRAPEATLPAGWSADLAGGLRVAPASFAAADVGREWWRTLGDPMLDDLVEQAVSSNVDVRRAVARVRAARAARRGAIATFFPSLDATAEYERRRPSGTAVSPSASREFNQFSFGFDSSWEIDLFGGVRRSNERAVAELEAAGADLRDVLVSVLAELARNYVELRSLQARIAVAENNARSQSDTMSLARWRFQAGLTGALDVDQAEYNLAETRSRIPALESELAAARNRVAILVGSNAGSFDAGLSPARPVPTAPRNVAVGLPADLLRRRPDVAAAERRLAAATASIGVAAADLYPKLTLSGTFGVSATDFAALDTAAARGFLVGPALRWNIFDAGRLRSVVAQRSAEAEVALADWQAAVLSAGEETENALVAYVKEQQRRDRLAEGRTAARRAQELARLQYEHGLVDFQRVLEAERATLGLEETLARSEAAVITNLIALYKAIGGGWEVADCGDDGCAARGSAVAD